MDEEKIKEVAVTLKMEYRHNLSVNGFNNIFKADTNKNYLESDSLV